MLGFCANAEKDLGRSVRFQTKITLSDGPGHLLFSSHEILEKSASIVAPPRANTTRYHGILVPNSKSRSKVVPASIDDSKDDPEDERKKSGSGKYRLSWSFLLARIFQINVSVCLCCKMAVDCNFSTKDDFYQPLIHTKRRAKALVLKRTTPLRRQTIAGQRQLLAPCNTSTICRYSLFPTPVS
ncbi:MAG: hypothetical protein GY854_31370 [Deltaproteobacteria bacterium]|nr:hypothetical protein [Deltaproteobacteria bacterium]